MWLCRTFGPICRGLVEYAPVRRKIMRTVKGRARAGDATGWRNRGDFYPPISQVTLTSTLSACSPASTATSATASARMAMAAILRGTGR